MNYLIYIVHFHIWLPALCFRLEHILDVICRPDGASPSIPKATVKLWCTLGWNGNLWDFFFVCPLRYLSFWMGHVVWSETSQHWAWKHARGVRCGGLCYLRQSSFSSDTDQGHFITHLPKFSFFPLSVLKKVPFQERILNFILFSCNQGFVNTCTKPLIVAA